MEPARTGADLSTFVHREPFVGDGGSGDVTAELFELVTPVGLATGCGVQGKSRLVSKIVGMVMGCFVLMSCVIRPDRIRSGVAFVVPCANAVIDRRSRILSSLGVATGNHRSISRVSAILSTRLHGYGACLLPSTRHHRLAFPSVSQILPETPGAFLD